VKHKAASLTPLCPRFTTNNTELRNLFPS